MTNFISEIDCPTRRKTVSTLVCHTCPNHIKVLFRGEAPPELQCAKWEWECENQGGVDENRRRQASGL